MGPLQRQVHPPTIPRLALPALGLFLGLACVALAPTAASAMAREGSGHAGHSCRCGPNCSGVACCCARREPEPAAPPRSAPTDGADEPDDRPCLGARPCGVPCVPPAPGSTGPPGRDAAPASCARLRPTSPAWLTHHVPRCLLPARRVDRLDDPPESAGLA